MPGHVPVHAARVSEAAREVHCGGAGFSVSGINFCGSEQAAPSLAELPWRLRSSFCGGIAWKSNQAGPLGSSSTLTIPEMVVGGSSSCENPGRELEIVEFVGPPSTSGSGGTKTQAELGRPAITASHCGVF